MPDIRFLLFLGATMSLILNLLFNLGNCLTKTQHQKKALNKWALITGFIALVLSVSGLLSL